MGERSLRSAITTRGNVAPIVHPQDSTTVVVHVCQIPRVFSGLVHHVSVCRVRIGEEIPSAAGITQHGGEKEKTSLYVLEERVACVFAL